MHRSIAPAVDVPFAAVSELDRKVFPERRDVFLRHWLRQPMSGAYVARDGGRSTGYTVVRKCREGWKIGPLIADDAATAQRLYDTASAHAVSGEAIFLDVPQPNRAAQSLAESRGLTPVFETARMYTGADPAIDLSKLYGVTTFELG